LFAARVEGGPQTNWKAIGRLPFLVCRRRRPRDTVKIVVFVEDICAVRNANELNGKEFLRFSKEIAVSYLLKTNRGFLRKSALNGKEFNDRRYWNKLYIQQKGLF